MLNSLSEPIQNFDSLKSAGFKSTAPKLVVTRTCKLHLQQNKKKKKRLNTLDGYLELAHLNAFHCHQGFCYTSGCHLPSGEKYKQNLLLCPQGAALTKRGVDCEKSLQKYTRTEWPWISQAPMD